MTTVVAPAIPDIGWFRDPGLTELTPLTVGPDGRVWGHLAGWSTPHRSFPGRNITAPRSRSNYRHFRTGSVQVRDGDEIVEVSAGNLTIGGGHADTHLSAADASAHYDRATSIVAQVGIGEDAFGIWIAGALLPDVDDFTLRRFRACSLSGDWRALDGQLDLVAALAVVTPGFPIPRARVASGAPVALVAAGALAPHVPFGRLVDPAWKAPESDSTPGAADGPDLAAEHAALLASLDDTSDRATALLAELDDSPLLTAALLAELDDTGEALAAALADLDDDVSVEDLQAMADLAADEGLDEAAFLSRMPAQLRKSYLTGKVAARIRWGSSGDFNRCVAQATKHEIPGHMRKGMCNILHRQATGTAPGQH